MNSRSLAYVAVRLLALYFFITSIVQLSNVAQVSLPPLLYNKEALNRSMDQNVVLFVTMLLPAVVTLLAACILWCSAYRISGALSPSGMKEAAFVAREEEREDQPLPLRTKTHALAPLTKPLLQIALGISGIILLVLSIPEFIHMIVTLSYVDTGMYPDQMQREFNASFLQIIVKLLLGFCLTIGAGGITRFITRSNTAQL
ncbi:hypothetical protein [Paenibacillus apiarius]|uniref:Uncharacterized protein n=1 Tax=Paenibacillus apiarius TaxID=46240 RepID=A0ABT4DMV8_9BACL|nr:hypothetical protein [Paenibacillus apiarius]MBN3522437.1 hypothetical protein [Paenibacillus apiarius]MCY9514707.1 hypothetical protein [Paenibacillus apiarius]MCY9518697.1 hypothetical protein [Paenibacillus apiarius]MCY9552862.1 hypothetical protein [Paenibacillus apiarius]MCY9556887.1 hypothetical protein [Paenibacillus apiarius]